jgi:hypothetical protein
MKPKVLVLGLCLLLCPSLRSAPFPLGNGFSYQGRLIEGGQSANGIFRFYFELFDAPLGGTILGAVELEEVEVTDGLFMVELDFGAGKFNGQARWLQISVQGTNGLTLLRPRQQLFPAPNSLFSATAGGVTNGAITSAMLGAGVVTSAALANGAVTATALANNAVTTPKIADGSVTSAKLAPGTLVTNILATTNNLALGTASLDGRLDVYRTGIGTPALQLLGSQNLLRIFSDDGLEKSRLDAGSGWGQLQLNNNSPAGQRAAILTANATGGGSLTLYNSDGTQRAQLFGANAGGELSLNGGDGLEKVRLQTGSNLGSLILNNTFGVQGAICAANFINGGGLLALNGTNGQNRAVLDGASSGGKMNLFNRSSEATVSVTGDTGSGNPALSLFNANGTRTIQALAGVSQFSTYGSDGLEQIRLWGASYGEILLFDNADNNETVRLTSGGDSGGSLTLRNANGNDRVVIQGQGANGGGSISVRDASGTESVQILGDFGGEGRVSTEAFDVSRRIRVPGAGLGTSTPVFIHRATAANTVFSDTAITHPLTDNAPDAILIVTQNATFPAVRNPHPIKVSYGADNQWRIGNVDGADMPIGATFNVLVVKP